MLPSVTGNRFVWHYPLIAFLYGVCLLNKVFTVLRRSISGCILDTISKYKISDLFEIAMFFGENIRWPWGDFNSAISLSLKF